MGLAPVLRHFRFVSRSGVLLKGPMRVAEVLLGPRKYHGLKNVAAVDFLVDFDPLIHENQGCFAAGANSASDHDGLRILTMFDDGRRTRSFCGPDSVILVVVGLFYGKKLLVCEENALPFLTSGETKELAAPLESYALVFIREELNFLELVWLEVELFFGHLTNGFTVDTGLTSYFPHGDPRISIDSFLDDVAIARRIDSAFSPTSWTTTIMTKLLETTNCIGHGLSRHIEQSNNFALTLSLTKTAPKLHYVCLTF